MKQPMIEALLAEAPEAEREVLEQAAALVLLAACADPIEPMPARLRQKLKASARSVLGQSESG